MDLAMPLAAFVGNNTWFAVLLTAHVLGAIVGLGPTFAFSIIGPAASRSTSEGSLALMEVMQKIERGMVIPILLVVQLGTGIGLIFNRRIDTYFLSAENAWLLVALGVYVVITALALGVDTPAMGRAIRLMKEGKGGSPEFKKSVRTMQRLGPILGVLSIVIVVLMVWKPGSAPVCSAELLRC